MFRLYSNIGNQRTLTLSACWFCYGLRFPEAEPSWEHARRPSCLMFSRRHLTSLNLKSRMDIYIPLRHEGRVRGACLFHAALHDVEIAVGFLDARENIL